MKETKDQTIERLKGVIEEQKSELTEVKKDRKRLNYAVERLEKEKQKLSIQSSKEDIEKIKELEKQIEELKSAIEELNNSVLNLINTDNENSNGLYSIFITWVEHSDIDYHKIEMLEFIYKELCLTNIGRSEENYPLQTEVTIEYRYSGSYEGYKMLKKVSTAVLKALGNGAERHIEIHGRKIEQ